MFFHKNKIIKEMNPGGFQYFKVQVIKDNKVIDTSTIFGHLKSIVDTYETRAPAPVGVLPSDFRDRWVGLYRDLLKGNFTQKTNNNDNMTGCCTKIFFKLKFK